MLGESIDLVDLRRILVDRVWGRSMMPMRSVVGLVLARDRLLLVVRRCHERA